MTRSDGRPRSSAKGQPADGPGGMPGPASDRGQIGQMEGAKTLTAEPVRRDQGIRSLKEDAVSALARQQPVRPQCREPTRGVAVVGRIDPLQGGTEPRGQGREIRLGDRRHRLADGLERNAALFGGRLGVSALVALGVVTVIVDEGHPPGVTGRLQTARHDGRVQSPGQLGQHHPPRPHQPVDDAIHDPHHGVRRIVGAAADEVSRPPEHLVGTSELRPGPASGADGRQPGQRQLVAQQRRRGQDGAEPLPIDRQVRGQNRIKRRGRPIGDEGDVASPPPDRVNRAGRVADQIQMAVAVAPDHQIGAPSLRHQTRAEGTSLRETAGDG